MQHFPIFVSLTEQRVVLSGGGEAAVAKLRLLLKTEAILNIFAHDPCREILDWAEEGRLHLHRRDATTSDLKNAVLAYGANEDDAQDAAFAELARHNGVLFNIVDNLQDSAFITPAIVDRAPVTVAIGTEGAAPVLARSIKAHLEEYLPVGLGLLAQAGKAFRAQAERLPFGRARRTFWSEFYHQVGPRAQAEGGMASVPGALEALLDRHLDHGTQPGRVAFVGAGPGDPELLTLKARSLLDRADVVIHDRLVTPEILELARREAILLKAGKKGFGEAVAQSDINAMIIEHALEGALVVRLKSGDPTVFGRLDEEIEACEAAGVDYSVVPGVTAASAGVAALGQSFTRRSRNSEARLLTGHDLKGFAEHDWQALARSGSVAAIYMAKRGSRFLQGRLLMHGADPATPVAIVENASRHDQRIFSATLATLAADVKTADLTGPAILLLGLEPRIAEHALTIRTPDQNREIAL